MRQAHSLVLVVLALGACGGDPPAGGDGPARDGGGPARDGGADVASGDGAPVDVVPAEAAPRDGALGDGAAADGATADTAPADAAPADTSPEGPPTPGPDPCDRTYYVRPDGDDAHSGLTVADAFATLARAIAVGNPERTASDVCIYLTAGTYRPSAAITIDGAYGKWLTVAPYTEASGSEARVVLSAGLPIPTWSATATPDVYAASVPVGGEPFELWADTPACPQSPARALTPARTPSITEWDARTAATVAGWDNVAEQVWLPFFAARPGTPCGTLADCEGGEACATGRCAAACLTAADCRAGEACPAGECGAWTVPWATGPQVPDWPIQLVVPNAWWVSRLPVAAYQIDVATNRAYVSVTNGAAEWAHRSSTWEHGPGYQRFFVEGDWPDADGEYAFTRDGATVYARATAGAASLANAVVARSAIPTLLVVDGAAHVRLRNLQFAHTAAGDARGGFVSANGIWHYADATATVRQLPAAVLIQSSHDVTLEANAFFDLGGNAVFVASSGGGIVLRGNLFERIAGTAVALVGTDPAADHAVTDNSFRRIGRRFFTDVVFEADHAARIERNRIAEAVARAVYAVGSGAFYDLAVGPLLVRDNAIAHVALGLTDLGAINLGRAHTTVSGNWIDGAAPSGWSDKGLTAGVYVDIGSRAVSVTDNQIDDAELVVHLNCAGNVAATGNYYEGNRFAAPIAVTYSACAGADGAPYGTSYMGPCSVPTSVQHEVSGGACDFAACNAATSLACPPSADSTVTPNHAAGSAAIRAGASPSPPYDTKWTTCP